MSAAPHLPEIRDYIDFVSASAHAAGGAHENAAVAAQAIAGHSPPSPLTGKAALLAAQSLIETGKAPDASRLLTNLAAQIPDIDREMLLAKAAEASGDAVMAVRFYQRVYYLQPVSSEAPRAAAELKRLEAALGDRMPAAPIDFLLERASRLLRAGDATRAKAIYETLAPDLTGLQQELVRVRAGVADYQARQNEAAYRHLAALRLNHAEADAERQHYMHLAARRLKDDSRVAAAIESLDRHATSAWRLESLIAAGNYHLLRNESVDSDRFFRACYESFGKEARAPYCHWKVAWSAYLRRQPEAMRLLREHVERWPASEKAAAALYFLSRASEREGRPGDAKAYAEAVVRHFPNYFHATLARERLSSAELRRAAASLVAAQFKFAAPKVLDFAPTASTRIRLDRARLLAAAGFDDWADAELRFAARHDAQPHVLALDIAERAAGRGAPDHGIRAVKTMAAGYLSQPLEALPERLWRLAFPMPYGELLRDYSKERSLDIFLLAALVRQESEFNPRAVSRARAHGLTQVMPSTGRELSRKLGVRGFSTARLFEPALNLRLGTFYLKSLLDSFGGRWDAALASYNGGKSRVLQWLTWANYEEPAEFIENIPITETRDYVQIILRNADTYRRLYREQTKNEVR